MRSFRGLLIVSPEDVGVVVLGGIVEHAQINVLYF
jgi:hypothetical protein